MAEISPLHPLLVEINKAARGGLPFLAVAMTVALPDLCVSLISENGRTTPDLYRTWCADNLSADFQYVTPDDLYSMRCGVLHNGRFGDLKHNVARVIFMLPAKKGGFADCKIGDAYFYSVEQFCERITTAVSAWYEVNKDDANVKANIPRLMQYRMGGFPPYIAGATVLA